MRALRRLRSKMKMKVKVKSRWTEREEKSMRMRVGCLRSRWGSVAGWRRAVRVRLRWTPASLWVG